MLLTAFLAIPLAACATDQPHSPTQQQPVGGKADGVTGNVDARFEIDCVPTSWGQNVYLVGDVSALGNWDPSHAVALDGMTDPDTGNFVFSWAHVLSMPPNQTIHFKFVMIDQGGNVTWESTPNRTFTPGAADDVATSELGILLESQNYSNYAGTWNGDTSTCTATYWTYITRLNGWRG
jgi:hypothetical protein